MSNSKKSPFYLAFFGIILAIGFMAAAFILGQQFKNLQQAGVITVKGVAEAEYKATVASWNVSVSTWGETYAKAVANNQIELNKAVQFLEQQGFSADERQIDSISVNENFVNYEDEKGNTKTRKEGYNAIRTITLTTKQLDKVSTGLKNIINVCAEDENINFSNPNYYLQNLDTIKRELISKATQDAYARAQEFAKTSNVKVGMLKEASQGSFDIQSTTLSGDNDSSDYGGSYDTSTIDKRVRLVVTIKYRID